MSKQTIQKLKANLTLCMRPQIWKKIVMSLSCIVVFVTTYMLILPAITLEKDTSQTPTFMSGIQAVTETDYIVTADVPETAEIPSEAILAVDEVTDETYDLYYTQAVSDLGVFGMPFARFFNIRFELDGEEIQPVADINVTIELAEELKDDAKAVHFEHEEEAAVSEPGSLKENAHDTHDMHNTPDTDPADIADHTDAPDAATTPAANKTDAAITPAANKTDAATTPEPNKTDAATTPAPNKAELLDSEMVVPEHLTSAVSFTTNSFSIYGIVGTTIEKTVLAGDGYNYRLTATYGSETGLPEDAGLDVSEITTDIPLYYHYETQAEDALGMEPGTSEYVRLFDIKIIDKDGNKIQPADGTNVDVRIELADASENIDLSVVHFSDGENDGSRVESTTEKSEEGTAVIFAADGFSVYAVVDGSTDINARMVLTFYNDNELITTMYVKNGDELLGDGERDPHRQYLEDIIHDPGAGVLQSGEVFAGWILDKGNNYTSADIDDAMTIEQIRQWADAQEITEGSTTHRFDAAICKLYTITYKDTDGTVLGMDAVTVKSSGYGTESVTDTVNMAYSPNDDVHNFEGWTLDSESDSNVTSTIPNDRIYENGDSIAVKGDISFTVNAPAGNWLIFDENGKGGTYNAPQFVKSGQITALPRPDSDMTRNGYTFGGWYDTKEHADNHGANTSVTTGRFTFGNELDEKTTLYASWIPNATAPYTVILWGQNVDRTAYEVLGSYVGTGNVGSNIPYTFVNNGDEDYVTGVGSDNGHYPGFSLVDNDRNQQITITPEGDAVLNLHYDRITYNLRIYLYRRQGTGNNSYQYAQNSYQGRNVWNIATWYNDATSLNDMPTTTYGPIYSEVNDGYTGYYILLSAYYGEDISSKWPRYSQIGAPANNRSPVSFIMMNGTGLKGNGINDNGYGTGRDTIKGLITTMDEMILGKTNDSDGNFMIVRFNTYNNWRYHIWYETVDGEDYTGITTRTYNGKTYYEVDVLEVRSSNQQVGQQNPPQYTGYNYNTRRNQNWNGDGMWTTSSGGTTYYHINYIYDRLEYPISYFDGTYIDGDGNTLQNRATHLLHESEPIDQGAVIPTSAQNYVPDLPEGEDGFIFEGWYLDEACTTPYTWDSMPVGGIKVYAKWRQVQYRVFLHPNAGTDPNLEWGSENVSTSFRISHGDKISTPTGTRENSGYEFIGWYTNPGMTSRYLFNSDTVLNDETVTTPYTQTENTELDKWGNVRSGMEGVNSDANNDRTWITKKIDLYAKWRKILEGSGINVVYTADDGKGHSGSNAPVDTITYPDQAEATAQAADLPPEGMYFKYWVVQTWNENHDNGDGTYGAYEDTELTVLPGQQFTVNEQYARKTPDPENPGEYKYTMRLRAEYEEMSDYQQTHIWWFNNYSADNSERHESSHQDETISINEAVDIVPAPVREGYTFLGWALIPFETSESIDGNPPTGKVLDLTANDVYLRYENNQFRLNNPASTDNGKVVTYVAADEKQSYHDLYAVWEKKTYKVTIRKVVQGTATVGSFEIQYDFDDAALTDGSVTLSHNGSRELAANVPYGTIITVSESVEGYDPIFSAVRTTDANGTALSTPVAFAAEAGSNRAFKVTGDTTVTVTNTAGSKQVRIYKVDDSAPHVPLNDVAFSLNGQTLTTGTDLNGNSQVDAGEEGYTGTITLSMSETPYELTETTPKEHYTGLIASVPVTVSAEGITVPTEGQTGYNENVTISGPDGAGVYTITVVNPRERYTVTVIKNVVGVITDRDIGFEFAAAGLTAAGDTFALYGTERAATGEEPAHLHERVYQDVPYGAEISVTEGNSYADFETSIAIVNGTGAASTVSGLSTGTITVNGDVTITYTNTRSRIPLKAVKTDQARHALAGATFAGDLITNGSVTTTITGEGQAAEAVIFENGAVPLGTYTITETGAPAGYNDLEGPVTVVVKRNESTGDIEVEARMNGEESGFVSAERVDASHPELGWVITVRNDAGVVLPATGGPGTGAIYLLGILLVLAGGLALFGRGLTPFRPRSVPFFPGV